jgi:phage gpG-like protein
MSKFNFQRVIDNINQVKKELPRILADDAQDYFLKSFKDQGWEGKQWQEVQRRIEGTKAYKYPKNKGLSRRTNPILIGTGALNREVGLLSGNARVTYDRYNFKVKLAIDSSVIPYAGAQNDGTNTIPARPFMKDSAELRKLLRQRIKDYCDKIWQG